MSMDFEMDLIGVWGKKLFR